MPPWYFLGGYSTVIVQKHKMIYPQYDFYQYEQWEEKYQLKIAKDGSLWYPMRPRIDVCGMVPYETKDGCLWHGTLWDQGWMSVAWYPMRPRMDVCGMVPYETKDGFLWYPMRPRIVPRGTLWDQGWIPLVPYETKDSSLRYPFGPRMDPCGTLWDKG